MSDLSFKTRRREPLSLQLTAMIDIFSMIVIFLILGSVTSSEEMHFSSEIEVPKSYSKESLESAPQVIVQNDEVLFDVLKLRLPTSKFGSVDDDAELEAFRAQLKDYVSKLPTTSKTSGILLSVIADRKIPYKKIFDVIKVFRESGFQTLLFVTASKGKEPT